ncbi:MAG TPA: response regulator [Xanthobacteraceae bacterium]|jgi:DNA-binding response OmpR family regulator
MASFAKSNYHCRPDQKTPIEAAARPLGGARILVVDDEFLITAQIECDLSEAGAEVVGPAQTLDDALALAEREIVSAAVIDIQLGRDHVGPLAQQLSDRGIPFVFYTGQTHTDPIRAQWPTSKVISKPATAAKLIATVAALLKR